MKEQQAHSCVLTVYSAGCKGKAGKVIRRETKEIYEAINMQNGGSRHVTPGCVALAKRPCDTNKDILKFILIYSIATSVDNIIFISINDLFPIYRATLRCLSHRVPELARRRDGRPPLFVYFSRLMFFFLFSRCCFKAGKKWCRTGPSPGCGGASQP